ncbi:hypothetical protein [Vibrio phage vB_VmeM-Yong XC32]|nr:hypothetical protein [Vibrio phage vB_VmeM-Yong XC31]QAX96555.1 hypothetical protein [Vibrio phage vB_VmeM-Yong XC32]QAX96873.1 hypothetical protein [Vibrio phage vB_VmeM-Yong MS31]QAX97178.1 hypothetical protein [Vibrio phage vB_VmeM-Yong MS32]
MKIVKAGQYVLSDGKTVKDEVYIRFETGEGEQVEFTPRAMAPILAAAIGQGIAADVKFFKPYLKRLIKNIRANMTEPDRMFSECEYTDLVGIPDFKCEVKAVMVQDKLNIKLETLTGWESEQTAPNVVNLYNDDLLFDPENFGNKNSIVVGGDILGSVTYILHTKREQVCDIQPQK